MEYSDIIQMSEWLTKSKKCDPNFRVQTLEDGEVLFVNKETN